MHDLLLLLLEIRWLGQVFSFSSFLLSFPPFDPLISSFFLGYEEYSSCKLEFLDIPNIHAMRNSLAKLQAACESGSLSGARMDDW